MGFLTYLYLQMDRALLPFYRFPDDPFFGYCTGTFVLAVACVILGEFSVFLAFRSNKERIIRNSEEASRFQDLSIKALKAGEKEAYRASNAVANEAFGKSFFQMIALSAASLWPVFFALSWLQYRFAGVEFPFPVRIPVVGSSIRYVGSFFLLYVLARIVFKNVKSTVLTVRHAQRGAGACRNIGSAG